MMQTTFLCLACGDEFDAPVWHCAECCHHWPIERDECGNCHAGRPEAEAA